VLKANRRNADSFALRLAQEIGFACQRLGKQTDYEMLNDGRQPLTNRLRLAVEVLKESRILLVLDNLEDLMPLPPAAPRWASEDLAGFFAALFGRLTGEGRCILTCRYVPEDFDAAQPGRVHEPLPDFSEAEFIKCLTRDARVVERMANGDISREFLTLLHRKIGGTPRFIKSAGDVLASAEIGKLQQQLASAPDAEGDDALNELREKYLEDIFVPELYEALAPAHRLALSRLALVEPPVPIDGVAQIGGLTEAVAHEAATAMLARGLLQKLGEGHEMVLYAVYPLQRSFLASPARLPPEVAVEAPLAAAAFFQYCFTNNREAELRLNFMAELLTCCQHAEAAGDRERLEWSTVSMARHLFNASEFRAAALMLEHLMEETVGPEAIKLLADTLVALGEWPRARSLYLEVAACFKNIGDRAEEASTWHNLATIELREGNYEAAREKFRLVQELQEVIGDLFGLSAVWHQLAVIELREGKYVAAREKFGRAQEIQQAIGDSKGEAVTFHNLASLELREGNYAAARKAFVSSIEKLKAVGNRVGEAAAWHNLGTIELNEGYYSAAREKFGRALEMRQAIGDCSGEAETLAQVSFLAWEKGRRESGVRLQAIAFMLFKGIGSGQQQGIWGNVTGMAFDMELDQAGFAAMMQDAAAQYQQDRGLGLVSAAYED